jgi:hypothetical protein
MLQEASTDQDRIEAPILAIEKATGFDTYGGFGSDSPRDYQKLTRDLGVAATRFINLKTRLLGLNTMHEFCSQELDSCQSWIPKDNWQNPTRASQLYNQQYRTFLNIPWLRDGVASTTEYS